MNKISSVVELKKIANTIRQDIIKMLAEAGSGHPAGALGMADVFAVLYFNVLNHKPKKPKWDKRDRLVLSNGHICPVQYAAMARAGYFKPEKLMTLRKLGSPLQGHPHNKSLAGIENSSGPLGQGVSVAAGMALAAKMDRKNHRVYCVMSDGELDEGQSWEALMFATKNKLDNLCYIIDRNKIQLSGFTEKIMPLEPLKDKLKAFGLHVIEINGHDIKQIIKALKSKHVNKPTAVIANVVPGKGVSFMEHKSEWHGKAPTKEEAELALMQLNRVNS